MPALIATKALQHTNFTAASELLLNLVRTCPGGKTIALVGPTQAGKSVIFRRLVDRLAADLREDSPGYMPIVATHVATSQDGRISPKHLAMKLLAVLRHPIYMHIGSIEEEGRHVPARGRDESTLRVALERALEARRTLYVVVDEAHHLTHTKDPTVRANVLQSIKCLGALDRTLVLIGGYELAYRGLFDSAHFAGRLVVVELAPYGDGGADMAEWMRILKAFTGLLPLAHEDTLYKQADLLLRASHGSLGLLEKILWQAKVRALASGGFIDAQAIRSSLPAKAEHRTIRTDIDRGREALQRLEHLTIPATSLPTPKKRNDAPFKRKPDRRLPTPIKVASDD
ncbi:AAA family ATPase [Novilysobacter erysipheiresistens]|uniref:AAA family ATPase n=1 Tax=Novilysobacter erysipheiresistens TaxID=1749332 RepID=A0ABU7YXD6_9GAMM